MSKVILGRVARKAKPNRTVKSPTEAANPGEIVSGSRKYEHNGTDTTGHDWLIPSGVSAGDMIWAAIQVFGSSQSITSKPAGYTALVDYTNTNVDDSQDYVFYKIADGTETDSTFEISSGSKISAVFWRTESNGVTFGTPEVTSVAESMDPSPITPTVAGDYAVYTVSHVNKGQPSAPSANYEQVGFAYAENAARRPKTYVQQRAVAITTSEDPGLIDWADTANFRAYRSWTIGLRLDVGTPTVAAGDHVHDLDDLTDVTITTPADNEVLAYDNSSGDWINQTAAEAGLATTSHASTHSDGGADEIDAADLASGAATDGHVLTADGSGGAAWEAVPAGGSVALDDLTDVTITTPSNGEVLKYNGSAWVNDTDATGGGGGSVTRAGRTTVGASWLGLNVARRYVVNVGELTAGQVVLSVAAYLRMTAENVAGAFNAGLYRDDGGGAPGTLLGLGTGMGYASNQVVFDANDERWFHLPLGVYIPATDDYWVALWIGDVDNTQLAYDNSGGDSGYITASGAWWIEKDVSGYGFTAETNDYSMHAVVL